MNILFVNYGDFQSNSLNHIAPLAKGLHERGHACGVAVPSGLKTLSNVTDPAFLAVEFDAFDSFEFPDRQAPDVIHAWTPREVVRRFLLGCKRRYPEARLVIHLEDHEDYLTRTYSECEEGDLKLSRLDAFNDAIPPVLSHPIRSRALLAMADGVTAIIQTLEAMAPGYLPFRTVTPPVDLTKFSPVVDGSTERRRLNVQPDDLLVAYPGNTTFANLEDLRDLYTAVQILREKGHRLVLVKTGHQMPGLAEHPLCADAEGYRDLGFIAKSRIPALLAISSVLIQPGRPGLFNDYRLPSKLPEFLSSGRPVITLNANLGSELEDGVNALLFRTGEPDELVSKIESVLGNPDLADRLGSGARAFAEARFPLSGSVDVLEEIYGLVMSRDMHPAWKEIHERFHATELSTWIAGKDSDLARKQTADLFEQSLVAVSGEAEALKAENVQLAHEKRVLDHEKAEEVHKRNHEVHEKNLEINQRDISIQELHTEKDRLLRELDHVRREQSVLEKRLRSMEASASWKLTKPLRQLRGLIDKNSR